MYNWSNDWITYKLSPFEIKSLLSWAKDIALLNSW